MGNLTRATRERGTVDLRVTAAWGYAGRDGVIMPGGGRVEPQGEWPEEAELTAALRMLAPTADDPLALLGAPIRVFLNDETYLGVSPHRRVGIPDRGLPSGQEMVVLPST
jgi:hypothetical protein